MHRCPDCGATGITVPKAGLDVWVCIRCGHKTDTANTASVGQRVSHLLSALGEMPYSAERRAAEAVAENADHHLWNYLGEQMRITSRTLEAEARPYVERLMLCVLMAAAGVVTFSLGAATPSAVNGYAAFWSGIVLMAGGISAGLGVGFAGRGTPMPVPYFPRTAARIYPILRYAHAPSAVSTIAPTLLEKGLPAEWRDELRRRLLLLLPLMTDEHVAGLGPLALPALTALLPRPGETPSDARWALATKIATVLGRAGYEPAVPYLTDIFDSEAWIVLPPEDAREAARRACSQIHIEAENRIASRVLLRAPGPGPTDPSTLLRQASAGEPLEHVLIAANPPEDRIIPCDPPGGEEPG